MKTTLDLKIGDDGVADVVLNRPEKMNALTPELLAALVEAGEALARSTRVRAVVLRGAGRAFCAGLDMSNFEAMDPASGIDSPIQPGKLPRRSHGDANLFQRAATVWRDVPVPVIAALHGVAFGGGLQIALGADIRLASADARLAVMEIKWGLVPDMAGIVLMRSLLRNDQMRELTYSGRIVDGTEALALGLVTRICADPAAAALALAREIAQKSPRAIRAAKRLLNLGLAADDKEILLAESVEQDGLMATAEQKEAVLANLEKRPPLFGDWTPP